MAGQGRKVFTAGDVLTAAQVQDFLQDQTIMQFATTAARGSAIPTPTEGMFTVTLDNDQIDYFNGTAFVPALPIGAYTTYTPTFTNFSLGNGAITLAKFSQIGKTVYVRLLVTLGSTSTVSGRIGFSLPVTATNDNIDKAINNAGLLAGAVSAIGFVALGSTTRADLYAILASGTFTVATNISSTIPGTWAAASTFSSTFTYEAA